LDLVKDGRRVDEQLQIRRGILADAGLLVDLFDEAIAWLVARGQTGQWGSEPSSRRPGGLAFLESLAGGGGLRVAELDDQPVGVLVVGDAPHHVPAIDRPELYIELLLSSRRHAGKQLGARLVDVAIDEARAADCEVLRVDCWADARPLVDWYRRQGFAPTGTFELEGWRGQVFTMPVL